MTATACPACDGRMAARAKVCPHCGHRLAPAGGLGDAGLSRDEAAALLLMSSPHGPGEDRPIAAYLLPHPRTTGGGRTAEAVLTIASAPLWALGVFGFALSRARTRAGGRVAMSEARAAVTIALSGAPLVWLGVSWPLGGAAAAAVTIGQLAAWSIRAMVRGRAEERTSQALSRLDRPAAVTTPALPAATAQPRSAPPAIGPRVAAVEPTVSAAPAEVEAAPLEGGPRLLR